MALLDLHGPMLEETLSELQRHLPGICEIQATCREGLQHWIEEAPFECKRIYAEDSTYHLLSNAWSVVSISLEDPILPINCLCALLAPSCAESCITGLSDLRNMTYLDFLWNSYHHNGSPILHPQGTWELTWPRAKSLLASMMTTFMPSAPVCCLKPLELCGCFQK